MVAHVNRVSGLLLLTFITACVIFSNGKFARSNPSKKGTPMSIKFLRWAYAHRWGLAILLVTFAACYMAMLVGSPGLGLWTPFGK